MTIRRRLMGEPGAYWNRAHNGYSNEAQADKIEFHDRARRQLRKVAKALGLAPDQYNVRTNMAGIAVTGETTLHSDEYYVQIGGLMGLGILARRVRDRKDYTGGTNNWLDYALMDNPEALAAALKELTP